MTDPSKNKTCPNTHNQKICPFCTNLTIREEKIGKETQAKIKRLQEALINIKKHQEIVGGSLAKQSAIWVIAVTALQDFDG